MFSKTIVVGYLGRDPELRFTPSGQQVCSFSIATSRSWTDQSGQQQEKTTWFRVDRLGQVGRAMPPVPHQGTAGVGRRARSTRRPGPPRPASRAPAWS